MNVNRVVLTGNLTRDPELRSIPSGTALCKLGLAVNDREKVGEEWRDRANFFTVVAWGRTAENAAKHLGKGSPIAVDGRLRWQSWETEDGRKRSVVEIVAQSIEYLGSPKAESTDAAPSASQSSEDDIPF